MAANSLLRKESLQLYYFLCQHIVGTEKTVRLKRLMNTIKDNISSEVDLITIITSGSFGEGLEMEGSDLDIMNVLKEFIVHEVTENVKFDKTKTNLVMEMIDTKPGFAKLRCVNFSISTRYSLTVMEMFAQIGKSWYLSSEQLKSCFQNHILKKSVSLHIRMKHKLHGPCLSDEDVNIDFALCVHNPHWIQPAQNWLTRGQTSWPSSDVKSDIIDHGVLFVPLGSAGPANDGLEWRVSFSVAEKLLIYSCSHTQLLCYALMKILLKDLIDSNDNCKELLCSYFIKTILFWVSEETPVTEWKAENLIKCFMRCFRRLLYCVEYSVCPHYFIPSINLFENKIEGQSKHLLLEHLKTLISSGWRCILFSLRFENFALHSMAPPKTTEIAIAQFQLILRSKVRRIFFCLSMFGRYRKCIRILNVSKSVMIKSVCVRHLSAICSQLIQQYTINSFDGNKQIYSKYRTQIAYFLQNINHDAVSGWLMLATFFYTTKQYSNVLHILTYAMIKSTPEKVYYQERLSQLHLELIKSKTLQRLGILRVLKQIDVDSVRFVHPFKLLPEEMEKDCFISKYGKYSFPPVVFAHFLCYLCHYHLNNLQQCYKSIRDLQLIIDEEYFIGNPKDKKLSYNLLGIAFQLVGDSGLAVQAFTNATKCDLFF